MTDRLPHFTAVALALALAVLAWWFRFPAIAFAAGVIATVAFCSAVVSPPQFAPPCGCVVSIGTAHLAESDFCRHGIVVGQPGVGKTEFAKRLLIQMVRNTPDFGAIVTDEKGDMHLLVKRVFAANGAMRKLVELRPRMFGEKGPPPAHRMNLIGDRSISWQSHAQLIADAAVSQGHKTSQAHFKMQAIDRMAEAMETIHLAGLVVTIPAVHEFIKFPELFELTLNKMMDREFKDAALKERAQILYEGWRQYLGKAPEELSGIRGTIENYTNAYLEPEIIDVFSSAEPTVAIDALDEGKVLLVSIPQQFTRARKYVQAFCKILYYRHSLGRFDRFGVEGMAKLNLHLGLFDEGHNSLLASEDGYSDFNTLDKMRSARCPVWFMMQCYTSALPALEHESKLDVLKANLGTHVIFRLASEKGHKLAAGVIGEHEVLEVGRSVTKGVTTINRTPKVKPVLGTWVFRKLADFRAIVRHPSDNRDYHHAHLPPLTDDGRWIATWYWRKRLGLG
jgi:hypothetical protein